jgi:hypothetical protein
MKRIFIMVLALAVVMPAMASIDGTWRPRWEKIYTTLNPSLSIPKENNQLHDQAWQSLTNELVRCVREGTLSPEIIALMRDNEMRIRENVRTVCTLTLDTIPLDAWKRFIPQLFKHLPEDDWRVFFLVNRLRMVPDLFTAPEIQQWKSNLIKTNESLRLALDDRKKDALIKQLILLTPSSYPMDNQVKCSLQEHFLLKSYIQQILSNEVIRCENEGRITPEIKALLADSNRSVHLETTERFAGVLTKLALDSQRLLVPQFFASLQDEARKRFLLVPQFGAGTRDESDELILPFAGMEMDVSLFSTSEIQGWMAKQVKADKECWALYLLLDAKRRDSVKETFTSTARRLSERSKRNEEHFYPLVYTALLALDGDVKSVTALAKALDNLDIKNYFDCDYVIPAAAMTGNPTLLKKLAHIAETDKRQKVNGGCAVPQYRDFSEQASHALTFVVADFPRISNNPWREDKSDNRQVITQWLKKNPVVAKLDFDPRQLICNNVLEQRHW